MNIEDFKGLTIDRLQLYKEPGNQLTSISILFDNGVEMNIWGHEGPVGYLVDASLSTMEGNDPCVHVPSINEVMISCEPAPMKILTGEK